MNTSTYFPTGDGLRPHSFHRHSRRLRGLLWRADATDLRDTVRTRKAARKARQQEMVKVVVVNLGDWRERHFGRAG